MESYYYLLINLATISIPLLRSFEGRVQYRKRWPALFKSMFLVGAVFLIWDAIFTAYGVWGFNGRYLSGIEAAGLPLGEWLFFFTVPYASIFIYEVIKYFAPWQQWKGWGTTAAVYMQWFSWALAAFHYDRWYTLITFVLLGAFLAFARTRMRVHWELMWVSYAIALIPFFLVNGVLTGSWIDEPIVWYNNAENLGIRLGTIPVEDVFYGMLLIFSNIALMEYFQSNQSVERSDVSSGENSTTALN